MEVDAHNFEGFVKEICQTVCVHVMSKITIFCPVARSFQPHDTGQLTVLYGKTLILLLFEHKHVTERNEPIFTMNTRNELLQALEKKQHRLLA